MAATVYLYEYTGSGASQTTSSNKFAGTSRLQANDAASEAASPQAIIRGASSVRSMERWLRMLVPNNTGLSVSLSNAKAYTTGTAWDSDHNKPWLRSAASGATPQVPANTSAFTAAHSSTSGSPKGLGTGGSAPYTIVPGDSFPAPFGDFLVVITEIDASAATGNIPASPETWTWAYDEA